MKNIAVLGASVNRSKFGNKCVRAYKSKGFTVFPINLNEKEIEGLRCYESVLDIANNIDIISIYLKPENVNKILTEIINRKPKFAYMNPGTEDDEIIEKLRKHGVGVRVACSIRAIGVDPDTLN